MHTALESALAAIDPIDQSLAAQGQAHIDDLTKPRGSLGRLEEIALQLYLIAGGNAPKIDPARIYTCAGDHGVASEGVSLFPQEVTRQMLINFLNGGAGINVLSQTAGIDLKVVDAGVKGEHFEAHPSLIDRRVAEGTASFTQGPAMTREQCEQALMNGIELADEAASEGYAALGTGDMGIGNTTPSTALYCAYLGLAPSLLTGPGTGLGKDAVRKKAEIIQKALQVNEQAIASGDPIQVLAALGGLEIATIAGLILGAAKNRMAVAVDGFISTAAYTSAWRICPLVKDYCFISHRSAEPGHAAAVAHMGLKPLLHLEMRLGEGTGAAMALFVMRSAADIFNNMATFSQAGVSDS